MRNLSQRVRRLENQTHVLSWWDLETWKAETTAGLSYDEQQARRLAEYPEHAGEIRQLFAHVGQRVSAALLV